MLCPKCSAHMIYEQIKPKGGNPYHRYRCTNLDCKHLFSVKDTKGQRKLM